MKKTKIIYTRVSTPNNEYIRRITRKANVSLATCLDDTITFMRENMSETLHLKEIAKRRNKVPETRREFS